MSASSELPDAMPARKGRKEHPEPSEDLKNLGLTLGLYILIFVLKIIAYTFSGVLALLAESLHTLSDIFVAGFLLIAAAYSRRAAEFAFFRGFYNNLSAS